MQEFEIYVSSLCKLKSLRKDIFIMGVWEPNCMYILGFDTTCMLSEDTTQLSKEYFSAQTDSQMKFDCFDGEMLMCRNIVT